ncbi:PPE family protein, SVP subgroup, partial [Mycobacterium shimoidei]|uniref:PPE family protein, SVP subgroup n=1 Tax=Mycobacterium shimoidei TaxID=29313 RepID=UPI0018DC66C5
PQFVSPPQTTNPAGQSEQAAAVGNDAGTSANAGVQQAISQLMYMNEASQAAAATGPLPAQEVPTVFDLLGLNALAVAGFSISDVGIALSAGAWASAGESTRLILKEQNQLAFVQYDILRAVELFSPLTPSRPEGYVPGSLPSTSATTGEAVSVGRLSVPMSWAANAPEVRSLAYTVPTLTASAAAAPAGSAGTAFSEMALAGMGGSALAGAVKRGGQETGDPASRKQAKPPQEPSDNPVTGIAAEIREFAELRDRGLITDEEYNEQKQRLLGQ